MVVPAAITPVLKLAGLVAPVAGGAAVLAWRFQETRTPVTARKLLIPPLGMSTGFFMFVSPAMRFPLSWGIGAFLVGALVLSWPLARTSSLERTGDVILMQRSRYFVVILLGLLALRLALHDSIGHLLPPKQTASFFFVLAFGMILRWRVSLYRSFRKLHAEQAGAE
jgi:membrane protein CcdC involved in cytochrome C biogenesis